MNITTRNQLLYQQVAESCSKMVTHKYSTSFSLGIWMLHKSIRNPICAIYGFVRLADEIVDTFLENDQLFLLNRFREDTYLAIENKISLNPILHNFQEVVREYNIGHELIDAFFKSMEMDLNYQNHSESSYKEYIYGSAEVVGLMCLCVFTNGNRNQYTELSGAAVYLGSAFQKVNFLRDMRQDSIELQRQYFPQLQISGFTKSVKKDIERDIEEDFSKAYRGMIRLPIKARLGVFLAYLYYLTLLRKIKMVPPEKIASVRIRVPNRTKCYLLCKALVLNRFNLL
ncbi:MAG TPA: phytoene/squalene synthase family protein [Balneolales bacterium]|nr:phytoene/squalene synthase family protein [Balneolales bacterium]